MLKLINNFRTIRFFTCPRRPFSGNMACCPEGSWGALIETAPDAYVPKGTVERRSDIDLYVVGTAEGGKCVIWNYDIFGFNGGRTKMLCDIIAQNGMKHSSVNDSREYANSADTKG